NAGENMLFEHVSFQNNTSAFNLPSYVFNDFISCSFDFNTSPAVMTYGTATFLNSNFEQNTGTFLDASGAGSYINITLRGGQFLLDATSGTTASLINIGGTGTLLFHMANMGILIGAGQTLTRAVN